MAKTREPQYQCCLDVLRESGRASLGLMTNQIWRDDPKRLLFVLARAANAQAGVADEPC